MRLALPVLLLGLLLAGCAPTPPQAREAIATWKSGAPDRDCEIPGDAYSWQADYCLAESQSDDLLAAQACMDRESHTRHGEECARRRHFKREWCRKLVDGGAMSGSFAECIADPERTGAIVQGLDRE
jgi:hypothetical protein